MSFDLVKLLILSVKTLSLQNQNQKQYQEIQGIKFAYY